MINFQRKYYWNTCDIDENTSNILIMVNSIDNVKIWCFTRLAQRDMCTRRSECIKHWLADVNEEVSGLSSAKEVWKRLRAYTAYQLLQEFGDLN